MGEEQARTAGRKPRDGDTASRPRVLGLLFYCPAHDRPLYVAGKDGKWLRRPDCLATDPASRPLNSQLGRKIALERTCEALTAKLREDPGLIDAVVAECRTAAASMQAPDPAELARPKAQVASPNRKIDFQLENIGES
jgi:site-specific DNA recombinase